MAELTKLQIIDETVEFYKNNPRSLSGTLCVYNGPNDTKCAFSRCCEILIPSSFEGKSAAFALRERGDYILKPEYRGHGLMFWNDLQSLHDLPRNWELTGNKLTIEGEKAVQRLKELYQ